MPVIANETIWALSIRIPGVRMILEGIGLKVTDHTDLTLQEACDTSGVPLQTVMQRLKQAEQKQALPAIPRALELSTGEREDGDDFPIDMVDRTTWMMNQHGGLCNLLENELEFIESGLYRNHMRRPSLPSPIFRMSPTCLNFGLAKKKHACAGCQLMQFVPPDKRKEAVPCQFIPLDEHGHTIHELSFGSQLELEKTVERWIKKQMQSLRKN